MAEINLTEQTVERILQQICEGNCKEGELFATEGQLEEQLNVSRPVLREAISRIRALGFLKSKQRKGLIISKPDPVKLFELVFRYSVADNINIQELAELRYTLELGAVELATKNASEDQLRKLISLAEEFIRSTRNEYDGRKQDEIELDFHRTLLEATGNSMISRMHYILTAFFARAEVELPEWNREDNDEQKAWEHYAIAQAIADRNAERARAILAGHLAGLINYKISKA